MKEETRVNRIIEQKQIVVYKPSDKVKMEVKTDGETVWLTIEQMAQLFGRDPSVIGKHIKGAFGEGEVDERINRQILPKNGRGRPILLFDLDVVISVGYRVKSIEGVRFRRWATHVLRDMLLKRLEDVRRLGKLERRHPGRTNILRACRRRCHAARRLLLRRPAPPRRSVDRVRLRNA